MTLDFMFFLNSILFGLGLAMDAFSVSLANGVADPGMHRRRQCMIAGVFAFFQAAMPLFGWLFVHTVINFFSWVSRLLPWISLVLLSVIGGKMIFEALRGEEKEEDAKAGVGLAALMLQGIATSIDALSVGFTIADYSFLPALLEAVIIAVVTFGICMLGIYIGRHFGSRFAGKAEVFGGILLILIGLEIFFTGIF